MLQLVTRTSNTRMQWVERPTAKQLSIIKLIMGVDKFSDFCSAPYDEQITLFYEEKL